MIEVPDRGEDIPAAVPPKIPTPLSTAKIGVTSRAGVDAGASVWPSSTEP